jgi:hypothetical protein
MQYILLMIIMIMLIIIIVPSCKGLLPVLNRKQGQHPNSIDLLRERASIASQCEEKQSLNM